MLLSAENKVAKKVGKASFTGCFRRNRVEWNAREGGEGKGKGKEGGNWMVARRRKERRDRIALDREGRTRQGVGVERNTRGVGEANDIHSHSSVGSGCCANEPQRRCEYRWYTVGNGERERESVLRCLRSRLCTPVSRPLLPTRSCRFIPVLLPRHTCFREYGAGPRCARIFAARWNFVISIPGNPERVSLPSETSDTAVGKKEKKPRNASRVSARVFPRVACVAFLA